jgi:hypothetical protein
MELILEKINTKNKTYNYFDKESSKVKSKPFISMFKLNNGQIVVINKDKELIDFKSGRMIFPYVKNSNEVIVRYNNFRNRQDFWDCLNFFPSIEDQEQRHKKFGNSIIQHEILTKIGCNKVNFAYCNISYFFRMEYKFNPVAIDEALKKQHKDYRNGMSMREFLIFKFGNDLANQFKEYL